MKQSTTRLKFAWLASIPGTCHVERDEGPNSTSTKSKISPTRLLVIFVCFSFDSNQIMSKCLLDDSFFDQSDANQMKTKNILAEYH